MGHIAPFGQARVAPPPGETLGAGTASGPQRRRRAPPKAGCLRAPASLPACSDVPASQRDGRLAGTRNHPGQRVPIYLEPL